MQNGRSTPFRLADVAEVVLVGIPTANVNASVIQDFRDFVGQVIVHGEGFESHLKQFGLV